MARARRGPLLAMVVAAVLGGGLTFLRAGCSTSAATCGGVHTRLDTVESCGACDVRCAAVHASATCVAGRCVLACQPGFADCDGHPGNGCEADLTSDRAHCGSCSKSCSGARCAEGRCAARHIATGAGLASIVADDRAIYAFGAGVMKYPLDGGDAETIAVEALPDGVSRPEPRKPFRGYRDWEDGADLYWAERDAQGSVIRRIPRRGGEASILSSHPFPIVWITGNKTHLFWLDDKQRIFMAPKLPR